MSSGAPGLGGSAPAAAPSGGGGGGGLLSDGGAPNAGGQPGPVFLGNTLAGTTSPMVTAGGAGGFGGGGAGGNTCAGTAAPCVGGGGGGGGFSGGGGGGAGVGGGGDGGGGGSGVDASVLAVTMGASNVGDGFVTVTCLVPEAVQWTVTPAGSGQAAVAVVAAPSSNGAPIAAYRVTEYGTGTTWTSPWTPPGVCPTFPVTGLTDLVAYTFTLSASNAAGWSDESEPLFPVATSPYAFPVLSNVPALVVNTYGGPVVTPAASNVASNVGPLVWSVGASPSAPPLAPIAGLSVDAAGNLIVAQHTTLVPAVTAWVVAQNANQAVMGTFSSASLSVTAYDVNTPVLNAASGSVIVNTYTGAVVVAQVAQTAVDVGGLVTNLVSFTSGSAGSTFASATSPIGLTGLPLGVPMQVRVAASNVTGLGPLSVSSGLVTPGAPATVTSWTVALAASNVVRVAIVLPDPGACNVVAYRASVVGAFATYVSPTPAFLVSGLTAGAPVAFTASASNALGWATESAPSGAVTPYVAPSPIPAWTLQSFGLGHSVAATVVPPAANGAPLLTYEMRTSTTGALVATSNASSPTLLASSNLLASNVALVVRASNAAGWSPWSDALPVLALNTPTLLGNTVASALTFPSAVATAAPVGAAAWSTDAPTTSATVDASGDVVLAQAAPLPLGTTLRVAVHPAAASSASTVAFAALTVNAYANATPVLVPQASSVSGFTDGINTLSFTVAQTSAGTGPLTWTVGSASNASAFDLPAFAFTGIPTSAGATVTVAAGTPTALNRSVWVVARTAYQVATGGYTSVNVSVTNIVRLAPQVAPAIAVNLQTASLVVTPISDASNGGAAVTGYGVSNVNTQSTATLSLPSSTYAVPASLIGVAQTFGVAAQNVIGYGPWAWTTATFLMPPPAPASAIVAFVANGSVTATIAPPPTSNVWSPVLGYALQVRGSITEIAQYAYSATPAVTIAGLAADNYGAMVAASNVTGAWVWSAFTTYLDVYTSPTAAPAVTAPVATAPGTLTCTAFLTSNPITDGGGYDGSAGTLDYAPPVVALTSYVAALTPGGATVATAPYTLYSPSTLTVAGLTPGAAVSLYVAASNALGVGPWAMSAPAVVPTVPQAAPVISTAVVTGSGTVRVNLLPAAFPTQASLGYTSVLGYVVATSNATPTVVGATSATTGQPTTIPIVGAGLACGTRTLVAAASNAMGFGPWSAPQAVLVYTVPPVAPPLTAALTSPFQLTVQVTTVANVNANSGYSSILGYAVFTSPPVPTGLAYSPATTGTLALTLAGLSSNTTYTCYAAASNAYGLGALSAVAVPVGGPCAFAPSVGAVPTGAGQITVLASAIGWDSNPFPVGYVLSSNAFGAPWLTCVTGTTGTIAFVNTGLALNATYTYYVAASNAYGMGVWSKATTGMALGWGAIAPAATVVPTAPYQLTVSVTPLPPPAGYSPILGYGLSTASNAASVQQVTSSTSGTIAFACSNLVAGAPYTYYVAACNAAAFWAWTSVTATAVELPKTAPVIGSCVASANQTQTISYTPIADVAPGNGSASVLGYVLYSSGALISANPADATSFTVSGLTVGQTYSYSVAACNVVGAGRVSGAVGGMALSSPTVAPAFYASNIAANMVVMYVGAIAATDPEVGFSPVLQYGVYTLPFTVVATASVVQPVMTMVLTGVSATTTYFAAASNAMGYGVSNVLVVTPYSVPSAPTIASASYNNDHPATITVQLTPPSSTGGMSITQYALQISSQPNNYYSTSYYTSITSPNSSITFSCALYRSYTITATVSNDGNLFNGVFYQNWSSSYQWAYVQTVQPLTVYAVTPVSFGVNYGYGYYKSTFQVYYTPYLETSDMWGDVTLLSASVNVQTFLGSDGYTVSMITLGPPPQNFSFSVIISQSWDNNVRRSPPYTYSQ